MTVWCWQKNRLADWWSRRESSEIGPHKYTQPTFDKGAKAMQWSKDSLFNKRCWNSWTSTCQKVNLDTDLTLFIKSICQSFKRFYLFLEKGEARENGRERKVNVREKHWSAASRMHLDQGPNPQPRHAPWLRIKLVTSRPAGWCPIISHTSQGLCLKFLS